MENIFEQIAEATKPIELSKQIESIEEKLKRERYQRLILNKVLNFALEPGNNQNDIINFLFNEIDAI